MTPMPRPRPSKRGATAPTCAAEFRELKTDDDIFFEAVNMVANYQAVARTAYQRIFEIAQFRHRKIISMGACTSHKKIAEAFNIRARLAQASEPVTEHCVQKAIQGSRGRVQGPAHHPGDLCSKAVAANLPSTTPWPSSCHRDQGGDGRGDCLTLHEHH